MKLSAYPRYRSTESWLGPLPHDWASQRLKYAAPVRNEKVDAARVELAYIGMENIESGTGRYIEGEAPTDAEGMANRYRAGDVLFGKLRPYLAKALLTSADGVCSSELLPLVSRRVSPKYLLYYVLSDGFIKEVDSSTYGSKMPRASWDFIGNLPVPVPTEAEQSAIETFLDRETGKLDALIAKQERLIELLQEKRQSLISRAVTTGLDQDAPMKDSGVEWLGKVPAHWRLDRGRFLFRQLDLPPDVDDGVVTVFRDGQVTLRENRRTDGFTMAVLEVGYQKVRTGDLVIHAMDAFAGAIGVSDSSGKCTPEYVVLEPDGSGIECEYFAHVLRLMARRNFIYVICPSVRERAPRFRYESFKDVTLPVPPHSEQLAILDRLKVEVAKITELVTRCRHSIQLMREHRSALISAAVTGKIDARNAVTAQEAGYA